MTLKSKTTSGIRWSSTSQFIRQIAQLITTVILARLLKPSDFGLVGMAMVVTGFIALFKDLGTSAAIIQRKEVSVYLLSSIYWVNVAFGLLAAVTLYFLSPFIANFYNEPRIEPIMQVLSLNFLISGVSILHQAILEKNLLFKELAKLEIIATGVGSVVGIVLAFLGYGVWSLVYQMVAVSLVTTILLWLTSGWHPKMAFHVSEIRHVSSYSLNLTGYSIFNYFVRNTDYLLIGKFLGAQDLGIYTMAYRIMLYPLQSISAVISRVMFPYYSIIQDDIDQFSKSYLMVASIIAILVFPLMLGMWVITDTFVELVFGSKWMATVILIKILIPVGMMQSIGGTVGAIYQAKGRTDLMFRWGIITGFSTIISFLIGLEWGIVGIACTYAIISFLLSYLGFAIPFKLIGLRVKNLLTTLWPPLYCSLLMSLGVWIIKFLSYSKLSTMVLFCTTVSAGALIYVILINYFNKSQVKQFLLYIKT
jgi:PST family polysaccharide transporter